MNLLNKVGMMLVYSLCLIPFCHAELRVYSGTVVAQPVIVELSFDDNHAIAAGRYAYVKYGKIIQLEGVRETAGKLEEQAWSAEADEQIVGATWQLQADADQLLGQWQNLAGKTATIQLLRVKNQAQLSKDDQFSPFNDVFGILLAQQSSALQLQRAEGQAQAGVATHRLLWQDKNLAIQGVQIDSPQQTADAAINRYLKAQLQGLVVQAEDCFSMNPSRSSFTSNARILYANSRFLSIETQFDSYCGGAYPNFWLERENFDRKTGLPLQLETQIYQFYGENELAFRQLILKEWQKQDCKSKDKTCLQEVAEQFAAGFFSLNQYGIVKTGVIVHVGYPHVAQAGDTDLILPFSALRRFRRANALIDPAHGVKQFAKRTHHAVIPQ